MFSELSMIPNVVYRFLCRGYQLNLGMVGCSGIMKQRCFFYDISSLGYILLRKLCDADNRRNFETRTKYEAHMFNKMLWAISKTDWEGFGNI